MDGLCHEKVINIGELISILSEFEAEVEIVILSDNEGNGFALVNEVSQSLYSPRDCVYIYNVNQSTQAGEDTINAVVLYPLDGYSVKQWLRARQARIRS